MTLHIMFDEVKALVEANIPVLLSGTKGSGKTTLAMDVAKALNLTMYSITMTRQTTLGMLLGFINVTGAYIPSDIYKAAVNGGLVLLDEINGGDPNVLLCLNTIENGYIAFPHHGVVPLHKDFRLIATQNPGDSAYTGRTQLDASTLDRFDKVDVKLDNNLEKSLVSRDVYQKITVLREVVKEMNLSLEISMRDCLRLEKRKALGLDTNFINNLLKNDSAHEVFNKKMLTKVLPKSQEDCDSLKELFKLLESEDD